ncbi:alpha/beta hydrolase [Streptomyces sp. NPDC051940]|uniref:alpha/beta fold hydrolase n=1 Tax=Streptomyces sp. NPDC051940 TaxID=3155675 RepID=UPI00342474E2
MQENQERIERDGVSLAVRRSGQGPTVLLINGTAPPLWGDLPGLLAATHHVVAYDRRSFGDSPAPPPATDGTATHAEDAAAVLAKTSSGPALVVGWSMGAVIALELACRHPEAVAGLVLLEPPFRPREHPSRPMLRAVAGVIPLARFGRHEAAAERFLRWALARRNGSSAYADAGPEWASEVRRQGPAIVAEVAAGEKLGLDALAALTTPVTIVVGGQSDRMFPAAARTLADTIPSATVTEVPESGHALPFDAAPAVADAVRRHGAAPGSH